MQGAQSAVPRYDLWPGRRPFIRLDGAPQQTIHDATRVRSVALLGADCGNVRPAFKVAVGDRVAGGQILFVDRRRQQIAFTAPAAGTVVTIDRSPQSFDRLTIAIEGDATQTFDVAAASGSREGARNLLLSAGVWPGFLTRPFGRIPDPDSVPDSIFVTALDTNPLAADAAVVLAGEAATFRSGLEFLANLTDGPVFVCQAPVPALAVTDNPRVRVAVFGGYHPAGLAGTHIHRLMPVGRNRVVWQIGFQDVIAIGRLLATGTLSSERVVALAGPGVRQPRLVRTVLGASLDDLTAGELTDGDYRIVSGSPLGGREAGYLGRYHTQVSLLAARGKPCESLLARIFGLGRDIPGPLIPVGALERAMAVDIPPVPLMRALSIGDVETAERLGCLELVEEDVALLSYLCTSGTDYGARLRAVLDEIEDAG